MMRVNFRFSLGVCVACVRLAVCHVPFIASQQSSHTVVIMWRRNGLHFDSINDMCNITMDSDSSSKESRGNHARKYVECAI